MTRATKPVTRETAAMYRRRPLVVTIHDHYLQLREKGRRDALTLDYLTIYEVSLKIRARKAEAEKKAARAGKRRVA